MLKEYLSTIANAIRSKLGSTAKINAQNFPQKIDEVYNEGYLRGIPYGYNQGIEKGIEQGKPLGKLELLQDSEYMNAKVSGTAIAVNDVSPIEHSVGCKLELRNLYDNSSKDWGVAVQGYSPLPIFVGVGNTVKVSYETDIQPSENNPYLCAYTENIPGIQVPDEYWLVHKTIASIMHKSIILTATEDYVYLQCADVDLLKNGIGKELKVEIISLSFSDVEVSKYGKNLCSDDFADWFTNTSPYAYSYIANTDWMISIRDKDTSVDASDCYFGITNSTGDGREIGWSINNGKVVISDNVAQNISRQTTKQGVLCPYLIMYPANEETLNKIMRRWDIQVELGTTATTYESFTKQTYQSTADGTVKGVTSISPNMTLLTNNNGVVINANYLRDIDTYINNLKTNVALTGGE